MSQHNLTKKNHRVKHEKLDVFLFSSYCTKEIYIYIMYDQDVILEITILYENLLVQQSQVNPS